jgi:hypothetical protein
VLTFSLGGVCQVSDKHLWWIKVNAFTSKKDWMALEAFAKERKSPIGCVRPSPRRHPPSSKTRTVCCGVAAASLVTEALACGVVNSYEPFVRACINAKAPTRETAKFIARVVELTVRAQVRFCRYRFCATGELKHRGAVG